MASETAEAYFRRNGIKYRRQGADSRGYVNLEFTCPVCKRAKKAQINNTTWLWQCHSGKCDAKGNEYTLKRANDDVYQIKGKAGQSIEDLKRDQFEQALKARASKANDVERWHYDLTTDTTAGAVAARDYLAGRGITAETIKQAQLGWSETFPSGGVAPKRFGVDTADSSPGWLIIPCLTAMQDDGTPDTSTASMVKCRNLDSAAGKGQRYRRISGGQSVLYAPCGIDPDKTLVLVGGEIDALSLVQVGWTNVASTTLGEENWDDVWTQQLEACSDIVLIYDNDDAGRDGSRKVAHILGLHRCRIGSWPEPYSDANECLQKMGTDPIDGFDIFLVGKLVADSEEVAIDGIVSCASLRDKYLATFSADGGRSGWPTGWEDLDNLIGGWRPGEVTMVTGGTGTGKTTFTSQAALHMAAAQHGVLYCPFEMGLIDQLDKWARQHGSEDPETQLDTGKLDITLDAIDDMPIWMFWRTGLIKVEAMRNTMLYAARRLHVKMVVIDHIHWMVRSGNDERQQLDALTRCFTEAAAIGGYHCIVVAHPNKQQGATQTKHRDNAITQMSDLKGSSTLSQDAHNVLSVWRPRKAERDDTIDTKSGFGKSVLYALKVRKEYGSEGSVAFKYWTEASRLLDWRMQLRMKHPNKSTWHDEH
jgi:ribosomal protein L37AE/L43A/archaellum biogenesis ATPase FlaH